MAPSNNNKNKKTGVHGFGKPTPKPSKSKKTGPHTLAGRVTKSTKPQPKEKGIKTFADLAQKDKGRAERGVRAAHADDAYAPTPGEAEGEDEDEVSEGWGNAGDGDVTDDEVLTATSAFVDEEDVHATDGALTKRKANMGEDSDEEDGKQDRFTKDGQLVTSTEVEPVDPKDVARVAKVKVESNKARFSKRQLQMCERVAHDYKDQANLRDEELPDVINWDDDTGGYWDIYECKDGPIVRVSPGVYYDEDKNATFLRTNVKSEEERNVETKSKWRGKPVICLKGAALARTKRKIVEGRRAKQGGKPAPEPFKCEDQVMAVDAANEPEAAGNDGAAAGNDAKAARDEREGAEDDGEAAKDDGEAAEDDGEAAEDDGEAAEDDEASVSGGTLSKLAKWLGVS